MCLVVLSKFPLAWGCPLPELSRRRRYLVLAVCCLSLFLAPSLGALVAFRALQAVGGSMLNPVAMAIVTGMCAFSGFLFLITLYLQEVRGYSR